MKKNGEYVGVDERFIPENEKYVDESLVGNKEKSKKVAKRFGIGYLGFLVIFFIIVISMAVFMFTSFKSQSNKNRINFYFEQYQGAQDKYNLERALDKAVTNNKTTKNIITVVYNDTVATTEDELVSIKRSLDESTEYECSLDYNSKGVVNKITIKDIK